MDKTRASLGNHVYAEIVAYGIRLYTSNEDRDDNIICLNRYVIENLLEYLKENNLA